MTVAVADRAQDARQVVQQLIAASRIYDQRQMAVASDQLARIGKPAVPALINAMDDIDGNVRWQAIVALGRIGSPVATVATSQLMRALDDIDPDVRTAAADTLGQLNAREARVTRALRPLVNDPHGQVRSASWWALWTVANDQQAIPHLIRLLNDKDWMVSQAASKYLARIGSPAVGPLIGVLETSHDRSRASAADALARMGAAAEPAVDALKPLLAHPRPAVATSASRALGRIGSPALPALLHELRTDRPQSRLLSIQSIATMGPGGAAAVAELVQQLGHADLETRRLSVEALGAIGPAAHATVPELVKLLSSPHADLRGATCQALGNLGPFARSALAQLGRLAREDPIDFVQAAADRACQRLVSRD